MSENKEKKCGIIMPISLIDGCAESHWSDVRVVIEESIEAAGFQPLMVSEAEDVGLIHKRIVQNLYDNPIAVCDVSCKNPNVMFELGMRLAFDKPTIIIKDDQTSYNFDTGSIEHLEYPRDLRFTKIVDFKIKLKEKIERTYDKSQSDPNYTTFLKHFGQFKVAKLDEKEVQANEAIFEELKSMRSAIMRLNDRPIERMRIYESERDRSSRHSKDICLAGTPTEKISALRNIISNLGLDELEVKEFSPDHFHLRNRSSKPLNVEVSRFLKSDCNLSSSQIYH